jgi:hypothetical protein
MTQTRNEIDMSRMLPCIQRSMAINPHKYIPEKNHLKYVEKSVSQIEKRLKTCTSGKKKRALKRNLEKQNDLYDSLIEENELLVEQGLKIKWHEAGKAGHEAIITRTEPESVVEAKVDEIKEIVNSKGKLLIDF